jgi:gliding motility-associated protein GldE
LDPSDQLIIANIFLSLNILQTPDNGVYIALFAILLLICGSALMSASEVAFFSLTPSEKDEIDESEEKTMMKLAKLLKEPKYILSTILVFNNLMNIGVIVTSYYIITQLFNFEDVSIGIFIIPGGVFDFLVNIVLVTFFIVLFGEATPKVYASHYRLGYARWITPFFYALHKLFSPINFLLVSTTTLLEKRIKKQSNEMDIEELNKAIDITVDKQNPNNDVKMLKGIIHFGNITVRQIMRPRLEVTAADSSWGFNLLLQFVKENNYSRIPVFKENIDNIEGVLYIKDLLEHLDKANDFEWQKLIRETLHTPETKKIDDLLREFQESKKHLAIVVDEFGGTSGIVTLEDILEKVVGDIKDEYDESFDTYVRRNQDGTYIIDGAIPLSDLEIALGLESDFFEEFKGDSETLAGLLLERFGRIPKNGEETSVDKISFKILNFKNNRIEKIKVSSA